jgi:hypothetical protein
MPLFGAAIPTDTRAAVKLASCCISIKFIALDEPVLTASVGSTARKHNLVFMSHATAPAASPQRTKPMSDRDELVEQVALAEVEVTENLEILINEIRGAEVIDWRSEKIVYGPAEIVECEDWIDTQRIKAAILAVLKGVREPIGRVISAGVRQSNSYPAVPEGANVEPVHDFIMTCCWRAMIDRLIKDHEA